MFERHAKVFEQLVLQLILSYIFPEKSSFELQNFSTNKYQKLRNRTFAQYDSKVYPLDLMQEVIDNLVLDTIPFLILLLVKEIEILDSLPPIKNVQYGGKLKLQQELQLISNLGVML
jgi:hypothetical protein